jgi:uncharacterized protein
MRIKRGSLVPLRRFLFLQSVPACRPPRASGTLHVLLFGAASALFLVGCAKKAPSKSELRSITLEITASARRIVGPRSEITIRPLPRRSATPAAEPLADAIYISTSDPSQAPALDDSLDRIARRHKLSIARHASGGIEVLDFLSDGVRTHSIHIVTPVASASGPGSNNSARAPRLAIILDDLGYDRSSADSLLALPFPVTVSVIPHLPLSSEVAEEAFRRGDEVLLHLPMQSESSDVRQENIELRVGMNARQVESTLTGMLETVPHAVGVNNHEGSLATSDPALMRELMPALRQRGLFFIDSRTTAATVAYTTAEQAGVRAASRKVFLDDTATKQAVRAQLELAARDASRNGFAIAIGHPHPATVAALAEVVPQLQARGIRLVFASDLVR